MASNMEFPLRFKRQYAEPLDADTYSETIAELDDIKTRPNSYAGMLVSCREDGKVYKLGLDGEFALLAEGSGTWSIINDIQASDNTTYSSNKVTELLSSATGGGAVIDDTAVSTTTVFSSNKVSTDYALKDEIPIIENIISDDEILTNKTYSSSKIEDIVSQKTDIDDSITSATKTWSSERIMKIINSVSTVYKVDEKPTHVDNGDGTYTTTYVKNGETKNTTDLAWFYYLVDNILYQTIFIEGDELTIKNSNLSELISIDEATHHWLIDGEDTGISANAETLEPNINNSTTNYRLDIMKSDGTKKFTTDNLKGADGVLLDNIGYYGFTIEGGSLILHVNVEDASTGNADDIAPPFSLDTGCNLWYTVGGKIKYVSKEVI